jgi:hypothetical protein
MLHVNGMRQVLAPDNIAQVEVDAERVADGALPTVTVTDCVLEFPPAPVQYKVYVVETVKLPVLSLPDVAFAPANVPPVALQLVAFVELHERVVAVL